MAFNPSMPFGHPGFGGLPSRWFGGGNPTSVSQQNFPTNVGGNMGMRSNPNDMMMGNRFGGLAQNPMPPQQMQPPAFQGNAPAFQGQQQPQNVSAMMQQFAGPQGQFGQQAPQFMPPNQFQGAGVQNPSIQPFPQGMPGGAQMPQQAQQALNLLGGDRQAPQLGGLGQALMQARMQPLR